VLSERELASRVEINWERYVKIVDIEASCAVDIASTMIPATARYLGQPPGRPRRDQQIVSGLGLGICSSCHQGPEHAFEAHQRVRPGGEPSQPRSSARGSARSSTSSRRSSPTTSGVASIGAALPAEVPDRLTRPADVQAGRILAPHARPSPCIGRYRARGSKRRIDRQDRSRGGERDPVHPAPVHRHHRARQGRHDPDSPARGFGRARHGSTARPSRGSPGSPRATSGWPRT
jgi:hypothetical protein